MKDYKPVPTLARLHKDDAFVRGVMGPIGSGKSVGMCWEVFFRALTQPIHPETKKRRSRWAFVRNTAQQLRDTTLATWMEWFPEGDMGRFKASDMIYEFRFQDIELDILFRALDRPDDIRRLLSLELTGAWINEAREVPWQIVDGLTGRVGRFPPKQEEGCQWTGLIMDTNPPDDDHWWHSIFEERRPPGVTLDAVTESDRASIRKLYHGYRQPPGVVKVNGEWQLNEGQVAGIRHAENVDNLPAHYYDKYVVGKGPDVIKVYAEGKYGITSDGRPVFPAYDDDLHCPKDLSGKPVEIPYDPLLPLFAGMDSSVTGQAIVIAQVSRRGQLRILQEVCSDGSGLEDFIEHGVKPALSRFDKGIWRDCWFDPNANKRSDLDERQALIYLNNGYEDVAPKLPFDVVTAPTNSIQPRIGAVNHFLTRLIPKELNEKSAPALLIDGVHCPRLRKGFQGKYEFKRVQVAGEDRFKDIPSKNRYSHCFVAGTMVSTPDGQRPIEQIEVGDLVNTPDGPKPVQSVMSREAEVMRLRLDGVELVGTGDHPVATVSGYCRLDALKYGSTVFTESYEWADQEFTRYRSSSAFGTTGSRPAITSPIGGATAASTCTGWSGNTITARSPRTTTYTTSTGIEVTTSLPICNSWALATTSATTAATRSVSSSFGSISTAFATSLRRGTAPMRGGSFTDVSVASHGWGSRKSSSTAPGAASRTKPDDNCGSGGSVLRAVRAWLGARLGWTTKTGPVSSAGIRSGATSTRKLPPVVQGARLNSAGSDRVYDLTVEDAHAFYANGVLVSNCQDAIQYLCLGARQDREEDEEEYRAIHQPQSRYSGY